MTEAFGLSMPPWDKYTVVVTYTVVGTCGGPVGAGVVVIWSAKNPFEVQYELYIFTAIEMSTAARPTVQAFSMQEERY